MNRQRFLLPGLLLLTAARLTVLPLRELSPVECYTLLCARLGGLWHAMLGPVLPMLAELSSVPFGGSAFGLRLLAPFLILGASLLLWLLGRGLFDEYTATWAVVFFNALPCVNLAAVTFTPMTFGIVLSIGLLFALRLALHRSHPWHLYWWLVSGVLVLGFFTHWWFLALAVSLGAALAITGRGRRILLKWPVLPILLGTSGIMLTIFVAWDSEHHWLAFGSYPIRKLPFFDGLWQLLFVQTLPLFFVFIWALLRSAQRTPLTYPVAFLLAFAWPLITLDFLAIPGSAWPQCGFAGWTGPVVLLLAHQTVLWQPRPLRIKIIARTLFFGITAVQAYAITLSDGVRHQGIPWNYHRGDPHASALPPDPSRYLIGWIQTATTLRDIISHEKPAYPLPHLVATDHWELAAPLSWYSETQHLLPAGPSGVAVSLLSRRPGTNTPFSLWAHWKDPTDDAKTLFFVTDQDDADAPPTYVTQLFPHVRMVGFYNVMCDDRLVRTMKVFACSR